MVTNSSGKGVLLHEVEHAQPDCSFTADTGFVNASASKTLTFFFLAKSKNWELNRQHKKASYFKQFCCFDCFE